VAEHAGRRVSLLDELQASAGYEAALLATFNSYLPFVEEVVLPRLRAAGCRYVVALLDGGQLSAEIAQERHRPVLAGRRYGVLPIAHGRAFHPKLTLLIGAKKARLIVGSHNLTMSGFIQNRELTNVIDIAGPKDRSGAACLLEVLEFTKAWSSELPPVLRAMVDDFEKLCAAYKGPTADDTNLAVVGSRPSGQPLWQRVRRFLPERATRAIVIGPFFDGGLAFPKRLIDDLGLKELVVGIDSRTACFPGNLKKLPPAMRVVEAHDLSPGRGYLHAKALLIEGKTERVLITGSANPTAAAWLNAADSRNAELVVIRRLGKDGDGALGLTRLAEEAPIDAAVLARLRTRPEPAELSSSIGPPLIGICHGTSVHIDVQFQDLGEVVLRDLRGSDLPASLQKTPTGFVAHVGDRAHEASVIEANLDGVPRFGFVHHPDLLREAALSSSQQKVREALRGLSGSVSDLEGLLRLVEKVIFDATPVAGEARGTTAPKERKHEKIEESTARLVDTLKRDGENEQRHLSTGDLGLLLDYLMRKLWRSLSHEAGAEGRSEVDLVDSENEDLPEQTFGDRDIAAAWCRKSRTLLRRLTRRVDEGADAPQVVIEAAAVLGVLEAVRRVEDHDRWRSLDVQLVDRDAAGDFIFDAVPRLLFRGSGLLDQSTEAVGPSFAEQRSAVEWLVWLAWLAGFGPSELVRDLDPEDPEADSKAAEDLARTLLIAGRVKDLDATRLLELLEATPFAEVDPRVWLDELVRLGEVAADSRRASVMNRAPEAGDLVLLKNGAGPYVVRAVRAGKVDLVDLSRESETATFVPTVLRVLDWKTLLEAQAVG
jgi:hypothetical protein